MLLILAMITIYWKRGKNVYVHSPENLCEGQGHIMYFLVNALSPKPLYVAASNIAGA